MTIITFHKYLSANDVGETGGHQGGILIPKGDRELLAFLPRLDPAIKNSDAWIECIDEDGVSRKFRFVYYNNALHEELGTRNEYRITHMTAYFRDSGAHSGDTFEISRESGRGPHRIRIIAQVTGGPHADSGEGIRIRIRSTWQRVH